MEDPLPRRGGAVETWLKRHRDQHPAGEPSWDALNDALDDLRDRSDIGATWTDTLDDTAGYPEVVSPPPAGDGFAWARAQLAPPPAGSGVAAGDFVAANEALGEALTQVGMALGLPKPRPGSTWGVDEVLRRARVAGSGVAEHEYGPDEIALMRVALAVALAEIERQR
jgi:hypothetical protein